MGQRSPPVIYRMPAAAAQNAFVEGSHHRGFAANRQRRSQPGLRLRNFCPAYPRRSIQPIPRRAPGDTVALKVALEVPIRYFVTVAPLLHHPDRGKLNDNLRQGSARPRARAAAEFTVNNQEGEREHTLCALAGSR